MSRKEEYNKYINSAEWKALRQQAIDITPYCVLCSSTRKLEVHHRKYPDVLGTEPVDWLTVLCNKCHATHHGGKYIKKKKRSKKKSGRKGINRKYRVAGGTVKIYTPEEIIEYAEGYRTEHQTEIRG